MDKTKALLAATLILNILLTAVVVVNQAQIVQNQVALGSTLEAMTDYLCTVVGESLETESTEVEFDVHLKAWHRDADGNVKMFSEHAGTLTNIGLEYIEDLMGNNGTDPSADRISLTANDTLPDATCTQLTPEIAANNLSRASATYASAGTGSWTITYIFTASGSQAVEVVGLNWAPSGDNNLLCFDDIATASMEDDDTLEVEWTLTAS